MTNVKQHSKNNIPFAFKSKQHRNNTKSYKKYITTKKEVKQEE